MRTTEILNYVKKSSYSKYKKNSVHKLLFGHVQILETQCSYIIIKTWKQVSIMQLYNLAKLRKWKSKHRIQFFKIEYIALYNLFWQVSQYGLPP